MKKSKKINMKLLTTISAIALILLVFISSPIFSITHIEIAGNNTLTDSYIMETMNIHQNDNIFYINTRGAKNRLLRNPYARNVSIERHLPNRIIINVEERIARGYVEDRRLGLFLLIDEYGRVLEVTNSTPSQLPVVVGLRFDGFNVGEILNVDNNTEFDTMLVLSQMFTRFGISDIVKLDISESSNIQLHVNNINFQFGTIEDADEKIRHLVAIVAELPSYIRGFVNLTDIRNQAPYFRHLT